MEDPNRMRTKLRLDLNDVNQQISEIEKSMSKNRSEELLNQHRKLIAYREKLTDQYEKVTGLNYSQVSELGGKKKGDREPSGFARILGIIMGFALFNAFYNMNLHAIGLYGYVDYYDFMMGNIGSVHSSFEGMINNSVLIDGVFIIALATLALPIILDILRSLFSNSRKEIFSVLQTLGITLPTFYIGFSLTLPDPHLVILNNFDIIVYLIAGSAVSFLLSALGTKGFMGKLSLLICSGLYFTSAYIAYLTSLSDNLNMQLLYDWVYIFTPILGAGIMLTIAYLFDFLKD